MRTSVFSVLIIITLLYNSGAAYPYPHQDVRITKFRVKAPIAEGGTALLGCNFNMGDDTLYGLQWSKDGQVFYRYVQMEDKSMIFDLPGVHVDERRSTYNFLTLTHFTRESAGIYRCEVYAHGPRFNVAYQEKYVAADPPRTCTTEDGYPGLCVTRNLCSANREYGAGVFNASISRSETFCPVPLICCKREDPVNQQIEPFTYKNDPKSPAEVGNHPQAVTCIIRGEQSEEAGECVPQHLCGEGRTIIEDGVGIIGPRTLSDNCPPATVCCKIPDNNEPKDSSSPSVYQNQIPQTAKDQTSQARDNYKETVTCTIIEEQGYIPGECVQSHLCGPGRTINEYGEGIIGPRTVSDNDCPPSTVCCKIPDNNETKDSASPSENQILISPTTGNHPETESCTIREGQRDVTVKCGNGRDNSASRVNNNRKNPANPNNYQNQLETPTAEIAKPQTLSCKTRDGSPGECVQNYLCDRQSNFAITDGKNIIDARMDEDDCPVPMVCCKVPDDNEHNNTASRGNSNNDSGSGIADDNNEKDPAIPDIFQNQPKTPIAEVTKPQPLSCKTSDGSSGECVQNYLCDRQTNFAITDGKDIIDARMEEDSCPVPMVCCKVPDDTKHNNTARVNNNNDSGSGAANNNNKNRVNPNNYQNQHKPPIAEIANPPSLSCKTRDGSSGECVQNYLCDRKTNFVVTDGKNIIDARMEEDDADCPVPMVCCKVPNKNEHEDFASPAKDIMEDLTNPSMYQYHTKTLPQEAKQLQKNPESNDRFNFDVPALNYSKQPSIYHLKQLRSKYNLNLHSTYNLNLQLSQAPIYPYIRVPRDLSRPGCGWRNPNGVNVTGSDAPIHLEPNQAKPGEFPWTVGVMNFTKRVGNTVKFEYLGNGALIHERVVLTAAHIFDNRDLKTVPIPIYVTVGDYDQLGYKFLPRKSIKVESVVIHENYNSNFNFNDFALVFLLKPVLPSGHVNYICLPPPGHVEPTGASCVTSGWGKDSHNVHQFVMATAELPVVDHTSCQNLHRTIHDLGPGFILDQSFVCAGESGVDSCKGSKGAPLACPMENVPDRYTLSGLVSWSYNCSLDGRPSVFARVAGARQWIDDKMAEHSNSYRIPPVV